MPRTPEPRPAPATDVCPPRYSTPRQARRGAWMAAVRRSEKVTPPVSCQRCGGFHIQTDMIGEPA